MTHSHLKFDRKRENLTQINNKYKIKTMEHNNLSSKNFNMATSTVVLGTPQSIDFYSTWQEKPVGGIVTCYSVITGEPYVDSSSVACIMELTAGMNPRSGCQYPLTDPFENTTDFERDYLYQDSYLCLRYNSVSSATSHFSQTFSNINLPGNEWAVAYAAFHLEESGYIFHIIVHSDETDLINLCKMRKWDYEIVGLCRP